MHAPFVIGIGGGSGSGKTRVADLLCRRYITSGFALLSLDSYYVDRKNLVEAERASLNYDHPSAIDHDLLLSHVEELCRNSAICKPCYCFKTHTRREVELVYPAPVVLVEGIFGLWDPRLRANMNLKIYVDAEPDLRFIRRLQRDVVERGRTLDSVIKQYLESVRPMYEAYIEPTKAYADVVVHNSGSIEDLAISVEHAALAIRESEA
jgi:uridine kinase